MRPVAKGVPPRTYQKYQDAAPDLIAAIGDYCSYCERQIETDLAVEHVVPKSLGGPLTEWGNFLLGCRNCNSRKGNRPVVLDDHLWPDQDNTLRAIKYSEGGLVSPSRTDIPDAVQAKAERLIALVGLDVYPANPIQKKRPTSKDRRWLRRHEVWQQAQTKLRELHTEDTPTVRNLIVEIAVARGLFSIWATVFENDADMISRLIRAFRGTASDCFDVSTGAPIARVGGRC